MTNTEKRRSITSELCKHITKHYPELDIEEGDGGRLIIFNPEDGSGDNSIEYMRSSFTFATFNWADDNMKRVEMELEAFVNSLIKSYGLV